MIDYRVNPVDWFSERKLEYTPKHFTVSLTPVTTESELWIRSSLMGRYSITAANNDTKEFLFDFSNYPAFEDPKEAMVYELKWS